MHASSLGRSLRLSVIEGGLATAMGSLFSGVFLIGFALALGATRLQIGIMFTLPSLCAFSQLLGSYWIERGGNSRRICLQMTALGRLFYLPVLLVPLLATGLSPAARVWWIVGLMATSNFFSSLSGVAWLSWIKTLVPGRLRVPFFGRRNLINSSLSFALCLLCGFVVDKINAISESPTPGFLFVFSIAVSCGFIGYLLLAQIPDAKVAVGPRRNVPFLQSLAAPLREANFRRVMAFYVAWNLAANLATPFYAVFLLQKLGLPVWYVVVLNTLSSLAGMAANNFWTRLAQRFGMKPMVMLAILGDALYPLLLIFVDVRWAWALLPIHLYGIFNTPLAIGPDTFLLKLSPDRNASPYMATFRTAVGMVTALAAVLGGILAESWWGDAAATGLLALGGLKIVFLASFLGRIASLWLLVGVQERDARPVGDVLQAMAAAWRQKRLPASIGAERAASPLETVRKGLHLPAPASAESLDAASFVMRRFEIPSDGLFHK